MTDEGLSPDRLKALLKGIDPAILEQVLPLTGGVVTIMFTDIVDSTKVKASIGDQPYFALLQRHNDLVRASLSSHHGIELKMLGDAFLAGFRKPAEAIACAVQIQQGLIADPIQTGLAPLAVTIGIHVGTPIVYRDPVSDLIDLSGTDVDKAARVEGLAGGGQVLLSEELKVLAKPTTVHDWGLWELKGLGRHRIFEVLWPGKVPSRPVGRPWLSPVRFLTSFVGREPEIAQIMDAVRGNRLVTLKGMGGIGKTRLADEVAARVSQTFDDGVVFVDLANTPNSEKGVVAELLVRLAVKPADFPDEASAVLSTLENWRGLLVLDNFEVVMAAARFIVRLLRRCPALRVLVTSQRLLGVDGEQQIDVPPMTPPATQPDITPEVLGRLDSFQLFRERARAKRPGWDAGPVEAPLVGEILGLTDGIPLSIELAAARVDRISLPTLRDGLQRNRSEFLKRTGPTIEEQRHASMWACIDWSFKLLSTEEQALFPRLAVFAGGCFAEDVEAICDVQDTPALLDSLFGQSLLAWEESLNRTRYRMLPTVREYAAEKLGSQADPLRRRHAQHFLRVLDRADDQIRGKEQMAGIARITADLDNIRLGMESAIQAQDHRTVVRYSQAFTTYLRMKARFPEALAYASQGLSAAQALKESQLIAGCQNNLGTAYRNLPTGDRGANLAKAIACYEAALRVRTERDFPVEWAETQNNLGIAYTHLPAGDRGANLAKAITCYEAALRVRTERDFPVEWAETQNNLGTAYADLPAGDRGANLAKAIACYEAALRVYTERDFPMEWAATQNNLGIAYTHLPAGDRGANLAKAIACHEAALRVYTERDFPVDWAMTQNNLGVAYWDLPTGDRGANLAKAIACHEAAVRGYETAGLIEGANQMKRLLSRLR